MRPLNLGLASLLCVALAACSPPEETAQAMPEMPDWQSVTGTISYRERIMLTPAAIIHVSLQDVSAADAPATLIAEQTIEGPGQVPVSFDLKYNPAIINERNIYVVRATIYEGNEKRFVTDTAYRVLSVGTGNTANLMLVANNIDANETSSPILDTKWQLVSLNGEPIMIDPISNKPNIMFDSATQSVSGFSGCNTFTGNFDYVDGSPQLGELATTMMACPETMELEASFIGALRASATYQLINGQLRTYTGAGDELLIFEAEE